MIIEFKRFKVQVLFEGEQIGAKEEIERLISDYEFGVQYWEKQADRTPVEKRNREIKKELLEKHNVKSFNTL